MFESKSVVKLKKLLEHQQLQAEQLAAKKTVQRHQLLLKRSQQGSI